MQLKKPLWPELAEKFRCCLPLLLGLNPPKLDRSAPTAGAQQGAVGANRQTINPVPVCLPLPEDLIAPGVNASDHALRAGGVKARLDWIPGNAQNWPFVGAADTNEPSDARLPDANRTVLAARDAQG